MEEGIIIEDENPLEVEKLLETTQLVTKKPRKPRTKKILEENIIIEDENPLEIKEMLVTKKPRKPRTKKNKLELENPLEVEKL